MEAQPITEEMIQRLMAVWPGKLPHKRAKVRECPILNPNDVKED